MSSPLAMIKKTSELTPRKTMRGHTELVSGVAYLPDRQRIITCSYDGSLRLWDLESGAQIGDEWRDEGGRAQIRTMALSPNGKTIASGSDDRKVRLWDVETRKVIAKWEEHTAYLKSVCWSPNGERVLSGGLDGTTIVWGAKSGKPIHKKMGPFVGHHLVYAVSYSPKATMIATAGIISVNNIKIKIWDAGTGKELSVITGLGTQNVYWEDVPDMPTSSPSTYDSIEQKDVWSLTWTSDEKKLITGLENGSIRIFDTATWRLIATLKGHTKLVASVTVFPNDRLLASTSWDGTARLWNLDTNLQVGSPLQHETSVPCAAISADGKLLSTGCGGQNAYVWDVQAILKATGLEDLLSIPDNVPNVEPKQQPYTSSGLGHKHKSFLEAGTARGSRGFPPLRGRR